MNEQRALPEQMYCDSCQGPMQCSGEGWFTDHALRDCIDWLARKHLFTEPVVFSGCAPRHDHECRKVGSHDFKDGWCSRCGEWDQVTEFPGHIYVEEETR